jgi:hypothetical protein
VRKSMRTGRSFFVSHGINLDFSSLCAHLPSRDYSLQAEMGSSNALVMVESCRPPDY